MRRFAMVVRPLTVTVALIFVSACFAPVAHAGSLDLAYKNVGVSFGNSKRLTGLRFNLRDRDVEKITGINATFWLPDENPDGTIRGLSLALLGIDAYKLQGVNLGLIGLSGTYVSGISIGLIGLAASERLDGIGIGVGATTIRGVGLGLIGVGGEDIKGFCIGGIGVGAEKFSGFGLGLVGVGGEDLNGFFIGGVGVGCERLSGVALGLLGAGGERLRGATAVGVWSQFNDARWFTAAAINRAKFRMTGVQIGLYNSAGNLYGVQLGLLNRAGNNRKWLRYLPLINMHL